MPNRMLTAVRIAAILALAPAAYGCRTAATVGAGAAAGAAAVTQVNQNVEATVSAPIATVDTRARGVLTSMGMTLVEVESENNGMEREFEGRSGENVAHVKLVSDGNSTRVAVSYRRGRVDYSRDEAQRILTQIQQAR